MPFYSAHINVATSTSYYRVQLYPWSRQCHTLWHWVVLKVATSHGAKSASDDTIPCGQPHPSTSTLAKPLLVMRIGCYIMVDKICRQIITLKHVLLMSDRLLGGENNVESIHGGDKHSIMDIRHTPLTFDGVKSVIIHNNTILVIDWCLYKEVIE